MVPAWEELAAAALASDETMQRDDALLAMFEASIIMGIDRDESGWVDWESVSSVPKTGGFGQTQDYDLFPNWQDAYDDGYDGSLDYSIFSHAAWHFERTPPWSPDCCPLSRRRIGPMALIRT